MIEHVGERQLILRLVDDHAHRVFAVVGAHHDDGALEPGIADPWHGDEELARERIYHARMVGRGAISRKRALASGLAAP